MEILVACFEELFCTNVVQTINMPFWKSYESIFIMYNANCTLKLDVKHFNITNASCFLSFVVLALSC